MSERPIWVYRPQTNQEVVERSLEELTSRSRITYRNLFEAIADVFATKLGEEWEGADELRLKGRSGNICIGYTDPSMWLESYAESWIQVGGTHNDFRDQGQGRVKAYQPDFDRETFGTYAVLDQIQRRELVLELLGGLRSEPLQ
ncbi:MAG: hypothetical protein AAB414_04770 [Patescibacteria group bacterium]